jgi:hypothetical protein
MQQRAKTVPKYSKHNRKPDAVIRCEERAPYREKIVIFFYILEREKKQADGKLTI